MMNALPHIFNHYFIKSDKQTTYNPTKFRGPWLNGDLLLVCAYTHFSHLSIHTRSAWVRVILKEDNPT